MAGCNYHTAVSNPRRYLPRRGITASGNGALDQLRRTMNVANKSVRSFCPRRIFQPGRGEGRRRRRSSRRVNKIYGVIKGEGGGGEEGPRTETARSTKNVGNLASCEEKKKNTVRRKRDPKNTKLVAGGEGAGSVGTGCVPRARRSARRKTIPYVKQ